VQLRTGISQDAAATFIRSLMQPPAKQAVSPQTQKEAQTPPQKKTTAKKPVRKP
jgi:hypothetical protein